MSPPAFSASRLKGKMADERERERGGEGSLAWWRGRKEGKGKGNKNEKVAIKQKKEECKRKGENFLALNKFVSFSDLIYERITTHRN